ncbi:hypothetical protein D3C86_1851180 [compost metagenome]
MGFSAIRPQPICSSGQLLQSVNPLFKHDRWIKRPSLFIQLLDQLLAAKRRDAADIPDHFFRIVMKEAAQAVLALNQFDLHIAHSRIESCIHACWSTTYNGQVI